MITKQEKQTPKPIIVYYSIIIKMNARHYMKINKIQLNKIDYLQEEKTPRLNTTYVF